MSSNECNERVNTRLFARASLWANNVSRNTWSPSSLLFMHTQTRAYMGKIPRKFALAMVNRCPAKKKKKRGQPLLINFLVAKIFPSSRIHEPSSVWVPSSFFTQGNSHRDEKFTRSCDRRMERVLLLFLFFFFLS